MPLAVLLTIAELYYKGISCRLAFTTPPAAFFTFGMAADQSNIPVQSYEGC